MLHEPGAGGVFVVVQAGKRRGREGVSNKWTGLDEAATGHLDPGTSREQKFMARDPLISDEELAETRIMSNHDERMARCWHGHGLDHHANPWTRSCPIRGIRHDNQGHRTSPGTASSHVLIPGMPFTRWVRRR